MLRLRAGAHNLDCLRMSLQEAVANAFAPAGPLSSAVQEFVPRAGQTQMALAVARTIQGGGVLVVEAGTGVGKTYSYLVPALLSGERVLLSTATKALQDQLFSRDLPGLTQALNLPTKVALLKGRSSYLCLYRLDLARSEGTGLDRSAQRELSKVEHWAQITRYGDMAELQGLDERSPVLPLVTSTRENCLGGECPQFRSCHVNLARRDAMAADLVVINHHLFFADMAVRESGMAELLPSVRCVIFDEAHQLNEIGTQFLARQLSTHQLLDFSHDLQATGLQLARGLADWLALGDELGAAARELRLVAGYASSAKRVRWDDAVPQDLPPLAWTTALSAIMAALDHVCDALAMMNTPAADLARLSERAVELAGHAARFAGATEEGSIRWIEVGKDLQLIEAPLDIAHAVRTRWIKPIAPGDAGSGKSWVFTSATLGDDAKLTWFTEPCGLDEADILQVSSPFDYPNQAAVYVPRDLPKPNDPRHSAMVGELALAAAIRLGGRTLVLTTTLRALRAVADQMRPFMGGLGQLELLVQGERPKRELMERFRDGQGTGRTGCVLVASASFWEGFDVPGDALQLVVVDKLPFPPPNDPMVEARSKRLEAQGRNPFNDFFVPEAAVALKQGAGRLIRRESDRGILVVCDVRLVQMGYGKRLLAALPPMRRLHDAAQFDQALVALTTASTSFSD